MEKLAEKLAGRRSYALIGSGWKPVSMIDVYESVTFTLWLCGCNLKCPFCHNWRLAEKKPGYCYTLDLEKLFDELGSARLLIDYLHVTGGEPLVQHQALAEFFKEAREELGIRISLNTNFTLYKPLEKMITKGLVDHLATDLKIPPRKLYGYQPSIAEKLWNLYLESLRLVADYNTPLELRVPVSKTVKDEEILEYAGIVAGILEKHNNYYVLIQPLLGPPVTTPRNTEWCRTHCDPGPEKLEHVGELFKMIGYEKVIVRKTLVFG